MSTPADPTSSWRGRLLLYVAAAVAATYVGFMLASTEGHFVPQIVDLYLICQYARAFAEGHPFQYNAGEAASTGSTSLLFTVVLGMVDRLGVRGEALIGFAIGLGAVCYVTSVQLARRLGGHLGGDRAALLAGALVAFGGPVVWGFLYGSDIAVFMLLFLWWTERLVARDAGGVAWASMLLAVTRPEGLPIAAIVAAAGPWLWPDDRRARRRLWAGAAAGLAVMVLYRALTGYWVSTSVAEKSLSASYGFVEAVGLTAEYAVDVLRGLLLGLYPPMTPIGFSAGYASHFFAPLALVLVLLGAIEAPAERRRAVATWAVAVASIFALVAPNTFAGVHFNRYLMWAFPTLHVFAAVGWSAWCRRASAADAAFDRRLFAAGAGVLVTLAVLSTARFAAVYGTLAGDVYRRDVAAARWIEKHLPRGVRIANLATSIEYLTGHHNVNLHGITSPAFFGNRPAEREAGVFESLGRLAPTERPEYLLTTVATHAGQRSLQALVHEPAVHQTTSFDDEIVIYRMRYDAVGRNRAMQAPAALEAVRGLQLVDELNVCDFESERAHAYRRSSRVANVALHGSVREAAYGDGAETLLDAGRVILGHETFEVATQPGRDLVVVLRTSADGEARVLRPGRSGGFALDVAEPEIAVSANGQLVSKLRFRPERGWHEQVFRIPASAIRSEKTRVELRGRYASFYFWFFQ